LQQIADQCGLCKATVSLALRVDGTTTSFFVANSNLFAHSGATYVRLNGAEVSHTLDAGYFDAHAPRYEGRRFSLRRELTFRIGRGFPRLVERDLPEGVGDVSYALSLAACREFSVAPGEMTAELAAARPRARRGE